MATRRRTGRQNMRYWGLIGRLPHLRADEHARRAVTIHVTSKRSTRDLSISEMNGLCGYLEYLLGERTLAEVEFPNRVSSAQASEIARLAGEMGWSENPKRLQGFCLRLTAGRTAEVDELTRAEAQKVLNGLVAIRRRECEAATS